MNIVTGTVLLTLIIAVFLLNSVESRPSDPEGRNNINDLTKSIWNVRPIPPLPTPKSPAHVGPNGMHQLYVRNLNTNRVELRRMYMPGPRGSRKGCIYMEYAPSQPAALRTPGQPPRPQGPPHNP